MNTFITIYLLIGLYFFFLVYCYIEDNNITIEDFLFSLKTNIREYFFKHQYIFISFIILSAITITIAWPYTLYVIYKNNKHEL